MKRHFDVNDGPAKTGGFLIGGMPTNYHGSGRGTNF